jgi:hypothetical protein
MLPCVLFYFRLVSGPFFFFGFCINCFSQYSEQVLEDTSRISSSQLEHLKKEFGNNKRIPAGYEKIMLYTLSYFPELKDHKIQFRIRNHGAPIAARPAWGDLFRSAKKRTYMILIRSNPEARFQYDKAPIPGQIGILGHELCHVVEFSRKTSIDLVGIGINHISKRYMDRFEFFTDSLCIEKGLGYYLMHWTGWIEKIFGNYLGDFNNAGNHTPTGERYMSTATIRKYIDKSEAYGQKGGENK